MGNSAEHKHNLLAKNWIPLSPHTLRNKLTDELIHCHTLEARTEEELAFNNSQLIKRAAINHPNVVKLIYFHQHPQPTSCSDTLSHHKVYTEHFTATLADKLDTPSQQSNHTCLCCPIANGTNYLVQRYGHFPINTRMLFLMHGPSNWRTEKQIVKVWINEDLKKNFAEPACTESEMTQHLKQIYQQLAQQQICNKLTRDDLNSANNFKQLVEIVFQKHDRPLPKEAERKKITNLVDSMHTHKTKHNHHNDTLNRTNNSYTNLQNSPINKVDEEQLKLPLKAVLMNYKTVQPNQPNNLNRAFQKKKEDRSMFESKSAKINFSYTDSLATPKQNKTFHTVKTANFPQSPQHHTNQSRVRPIEFQSNQTPVHKRQSIPVISTFNYPYQIPPNAHRTPAHNPNNYSSNKHQQSVLQLKVTNKVVQIQQSQPPIIRQESHQIPVYTKNDSKKQISHLRFEKSFDICCDNSKSSQRPSSYRPSDKTNSFEIVNEYKIFLKPNETSIQQESQQKIESISPSTKNQPENHKDHPINIQVTSPLQLDELYISSSQQLKKDNFVPSFGQPTHSFYQSDASAIQPNKQKQNTTVQSTSKLDQKYNKYLQKIDHYSQGSSGRSMKNTFQNQLKVKELKSQITDKRQTFYQECAKSSHSSKQQRVKKSWQEKKQTKKVASRNNWEEQSIQSSNESMSANKKALLLQKISNTQKILQQNRKKLQKLQLQKDLQQQKDMIKKQMESLLKNNLIADQSHRIKEKVKHKKATFAELKAEASKILEDLNF